MEKVRVRLLNDGGYAGEGVQFPVEVEASRCYSRLVEVLGDELLRVTEGYVEECLSFLVGSECEIIEE